MRYIGKREIYVPKFVSPKELKAKTTPGETDAVAGSDIPRTTSEVIRFLG